MRTLDRTALFSLVRQASCGFVARSGRPQAAPCGIATAYAVRIFRVPPRKGFAAQRKIPPSRRPC